MNPNTLMQDLKLMRSTVRFQGAALAFQSSLTNQVLLILAAPCLVGLVVSAVSMFAHDSARAWHDVATGTNLVRARPWDYSRQPVQAAASATTVEGAPS